MAELRAYRTGDEAGIRRLFELCHQRPLDADVWSWRYAARPEGAPVTTIAEDDGKIVGHVSSLPVYLERGARAASSGMWVDLMVDPRHRNLTLFLDMAEANRRLCAERGVEILFAFPNGRSSPVLKRMLGWNDMGDILALESALGSVRRPEAVGARVSPIEFFNSEFDGAWNELRPEGRWCVRRDAQRLKWRYRDRPNARYLAWASHDANTRLNGWLAAKVFDGPQGRIGDILDLWSTPQGPAMAGLLNAVFNYFQNEKVAIVSAWALEGTPQRKALEDCGLRPHEDRTHLVGRWTAERGPDFPSRHADWTLFKGDSDVF